MIFSDVFFPSPFWRPLLTFTELICWAAVNHIDLDSVSIFMMCYASRCVKCALSRGLREGEMGRVPSWTTDSDARQLWACRRTSSQIISIISWACVDTLHSEHRLLARVFLRSCSPKDYAKVSPSLREVPVREF